MDKFVKILLGIFGFATVSIFLVWLMLMTMGEPEAAQDVKDAPKKLEEAKEQARTEAVTGITTALSDINEDRKKAVASEEDPYLKSVINLVYLLVMLQIVILILAFFGIKI